MRKGHSVSLRRVLAACLTVALVPIAVSTVLAFCGGPHQWAGGQATTVFRTGLDDPTSIERHPYWHLFPELNELSLGYDPESSYDPGDPGDKTWIHYNHEWVKICSMKADDACVTTLHHFWCLSDGLDDCPGGYNVYNSWEISQDLWKNAIDAWHAGDLGWAYESLGYAMHHIQDALQPAHSNDDLHPADDAIENWFTQAAANAMFSWDGSTGPEPPVEVPWPHPIAYSNAQLLGHIQSVYCWDGCGESSCGTKVSDELEQWQGVCLKDTNPYYNMQKYFYMLYWANQIGNYFASDDEDGMSNSYDPTGWLNGYPGFPTVLHDEDGNDVSIHDWHGLVDNDSPCENGNPTGRCREGECDCDGDLTLIATWCYGAVFKASPTLIDLFRRTVDHEAPVTTVQLSRGDGEPVKLAPEWNNWPVTVVLVSAEDFGNGPGSRISGLWKLWGLCDGLPPADFDAPSWGISTDGKHKVECMSTDMCGNVEDKHDILIWVDTTPPEITFPDLKPNYLTSENFIATWVATDALSGVDYEYALLDGQHVDKDEVIDLALLAGLHTLEVYAYDVAGNYQYQTYEFEVFIDADSWAKPVLIGNKTKGKAMFCVVEFPAAYDVGLIDMTTCTLAVGATLDLTASDPVVGALAVLQAELMTGVGDHDGDGISDRMLRFNKEQFVAALGGQVGDIQAVVRGGLLPDGTPRFLGVLTVPVFSPPKYK